MFQGDIQGNPGLEGKLGGDSRKFWVPDDTCGPSPEPAKADEAQLAEAAVEESIKKKKPKKSRYELERYASKIVKMGGDGKEEFFQHLGRRIREAGDCMTVIQHATCLCDRQCSLPSVSASHQHFHSPAAAFSLSCRHHFARGHC